METPERFNFLFGIIEGTFGQYGDYEFIKDKTNVSDDNVQRLTEIKLDYDPKIINIIFNLEYIESQWGVIFQATCEERSFNIARQKVSDNTIEKLLRDIETIFSLFMDEIYHAKK